MGEDRPKTALATVAGELAKPVYEDVGQPAAREVGLTFGAAGYFLRVAVRPFQTMGLAGHLTFDWLDRKLREKFEGVPQEKVVEPPANIAGPLLLAAGFTSEQDEVLRERYAQLLRTAMHADTKSEAHPAFVEILRQLTPKEAQLLAPIAEQQVHPVIRARRVKDGLSFPRSWLVTALAESLSLSASEEWAAFDNLERLGLISIEYRSFIDDTKYDCVRNSRAMRCLVASLGPEESFEDTKGFLEVTTLGQRFLKACLPDTVTSRLSE